MHNSLNVHNLNYKKMDFLIKCVILAFCMGIGTSVMYAVGFTIPHPEYLAAAVTSFSAYLFLILYDILKTLKKK